MFRRLRQSLFLLVMTISAVGTVGPSSLASDRSLPVDGPAAYPAAPGAAGPVRVTATPGEFGTSIEMRTKGGTTLYVSGQINGVGTVDWMVDTGSGYLTINEEILARLQAGGHARFVKSQRGRLANGHELEVPIYAIAALSIGDACWLHDIEAAVFPGNTRPILGINVLRQAAPFIFSFDPPRLVLSHCAPILTPNTAALADLHSAH
jgi:predicted aspartyl protease